MKGPPIHVRPEEPGKAPAPSDPKAKDSAREEAPAKPSLRNPAKNISIDVGDKEVVREALPAPRGTKNIEPRSKKDSGQSEPAKEA